MHIHPAFRNFCGFKVKDRYGVYNVICFGLLEACYTFAKIAQEPLIEVRLRQIPVSGYIDNGPTVVKPYKRTLRQDYPILCLLVALGAFLGLLKCNLKPL
jgi:hypothetical protein